MPDDLFDPRLSRPLVRISLGLWVGGLLGPVFAYVLLVLPSNAWSGPYVGYLVDDGILFAGIVGLPCGLVIGLMVALLARGLELWWRGSRRRVPSPQPSWAEAFHPDAAGRTEAIRLGDAPDPDGRIARRTDVGEAPGGG